MPDGRKPEPGGWNRFVLQVTDLAGLVTTLRVRRACRSATTLSTARAGGRSSARIPQATSWNCSSRDALVAQLPCPTPGSAGRSGDLVAPFAASMSVAAGANASSIAGAMRASSSEARIDRTHVEKDACDTGALDGRCDHRHQCTATKVMSFGRQFEGDFDVLHHRDRCAIGGMDGVGRLAVDRAAPQIDQPGMPSRRSCARVMCRGSSTASASWLIGSADPLVPAKCMAKDPVRRPFPSRHGNDTFRNRINALMWIKPGKRMRAAGLEPARPRAKAF